MRRAQSGNAGIWKRHRPSLQPPQQPLEMGLVEGWRWGLCDGCKWGWLRGGDGDVWGLEMGLGLVLGLGLGEGSKSGLGGEWR